MTILLTSWTPWKGPQRPLGSTDQGMFTVIALHTVEGGGIQDQRTHRDTGHSGLGSKAELPFLTFTFRKSNRLHLGTEGRAFSLHQDPEPTPGPGRRGCVSDPLDHRHPCLPAIPGSVIQSPSSARCSHRVTSSITAFIWSLSRELKMGTGRGKRWRNLQNRDDVNLGVAPEPPVLTL